MEKISVVLNVFKRPETLNLQLEALSQQTIVPKEVLIWQNEGADVSVSNIIDSNKFPFEVIVSECSKNMGVWCRFAYALNCSNEYICIFDDDVIPGKEWLENCVKTYSTHPGLLGTRGVRFYSGHRYTPIEHYGWGNPNKEVVEVDIVGHAWFFKRELLAYYWSELPPSDFPSTAGEDMHFSYTLQKKGIKTFVPVHDPENQNTWGNIAIKEAFGFDDNAISKGNNAYLKFDSCLSYYTKNGFKRFFDTNKPDNENLVLINTNLFRKYGLEQHIKNNSWIHRKLKPFIQLLRRNGIHL